MTFKIGKGGMVETKHGSFLVTKEANGLYYFQDQTGEQWDNGIRRGQGISGPNYDKTNPRPVCWNGKQTIAEAVEAEIEKQSRIASGQLASGVSPQDRERAKKLVANLKPVGETLCTVFARE